MPALLSVANEELIKGDWGGSGPDVGYRPDDYDLFLSEHMLKRLCGATSPSKCASTACPLTYSNDDMRGLCVVVLKFRTLASTVHHRFMRHVERPKFWGVPLQFTLCLVLFSKCNCCSAWLDSLEIFRALAK
jgi:hypothetical protein